VAGQNDPGPIDAVVLAAGRSTRMGEPKPLLELDGQTFIERAVGTLRAGGCRIVVAVVNEGADWTARLADTTGALVVLNDDERAQQIDSLRRALPHLPADGAGALVLPVDHPTVSPDTVRALIAAFRDDGALIVRPLYRSVPGHPTLFARPLFDELLHGELRDGARTVIEAHLEQIRDIEVADAGVLADVNTPEDYRAVSDGE
jgi:molybdenum cofactor cytidylyltransferase